MEQVLNRNNDRLWTRQYSIMLMVSAFMGITMQMTMATLPLYAKFLGGSNWVAGLMIGAYTLAALVLRPVFGNLLDHFGRRSILLSGTILIVLTCFSYSYVYIIPILLAMRVLHGFGFGAQSTAAGTIISDLVPASRRGEGIGYFGAANSIGFAVGPALGLYIVETSGYLILFFVACGTSILGLIGALLIKYEGVGRKQTAKNTADKIEQRVIPELKADKNEKFIIFERTAIPAGIILFLTAFTFGGIITFLPSFGASLGIKEVGFFFTVCAVSQLGIRIISGKAYDRYGASKVLFPSIALLAASFLLLAFSSSLKDFILAGILYGISFGTVQPTLNTVMFVMCPPERRGSASAAYFTSMDAGVGLGAILWGMISLKTGLRGIYIASAGCILLAFFAHIFILRKQLLENQRLEDTGYLNQTGS